MPTTNDFFYDQQIRRFLLQFTRMFSNYQVEYGRDTTGAAGLVRVPVKYGDASRNAAVIIQENSASKMPSSPLITFHITSMDYARDRVQEPYFLDKKTFKQRTWNETTETFEPTQGNAFTVERLMPVPFDLKISVDIWTTNTTMKLQILEQILVLFNPSMEIQSTDNYIDWTSLSVVELTGVTWSSRTIPMGAENPIDTATLNFHLPIWLSPPARVTKAGVIHKIIASIFDSNGDAANALLNDDLLLGTRQKITPFGYQIIILGNQIQILKEEAVEYQDGSSILDPSPEQASNELWHSVIDMYGVLRAGISQIRLTIEDSITEVVGTLAYHPTDDRFMLFTIDADSIPANTLTALNAVIDPGVSGPGAGLAAASTGQRYLLTGNVGEFANVNPPGGNVNQDPSDAWGALVATENQIIEFDGTNWVVSFDCSDTSTLQYVTNSTTTIQYKWANGKWQKSYQGIYDGGDWSIVL